MYCEQCGNKLPDDAKFCGSCGYSSVVEPGEDKKVEYFSISPTRLMLLSVITFNLYEIYWFYKNWYVVKKAENLNISPFWRAMFSVFYCYDLFRRIIGSAKDNAYPKILSAGWLAAAYIILLFVGNGVSRVEDPNGTYFIWTLVLLVLTPLTLIPIQQAINFNNEKVNPTHVQTNTFNGPEVVLIVVGVILFALTILGTFS
ncbi:hypothetical protein COU14_03350 [Candidatus Kaiserbacteria bacterium CG10_big_fil_rev_8_21_14_0_10_44_10]|uniref:Zinc-ribbon domain-containing protein n=1 Tax=Candidatus Kaiserbacteria bacterium CG10_big_fil_rev_8_21_14_0_10_44_10 TaxID=1974606 RepID=A0A2H0UGT1_9BACT|nr:MAG: hypothetical protein COU14_03350 [Candidatus Kaiserbacteria bacterium CG10_big_fil_rev_8_21_14_0_10_44_10]